MNDERAAELEALCDRCDRLGGGSVLADAIDVRALLAARQVEQRLRERAQAVVDFCKDQFATSEYDSRPPEPECIKQLRIALAASKPRKEPS